MPPFPYHAAPVRAALGRSGRGSRRGARTALALLAAGLLAVAPLRSEPQPGVEGTLPDPGDAFYQLGSLSAFASGVFEGPVLYGDLLRLGDFGLGALSPLEGEVIVLDGEVWHADVDGALRRLPDEARTPFAVVKRFRPDRRLSLPAAVGLDGLAQALDARIGSPNRLHALRLTSTFDRLTLRSVPRQSPPYPPLSSVLARQRLATHRDVAGTLVGVYVPAHLAGPNVPGWHFHFVDRERRFGGHVLDLQIGPAVAELDSSRSLTLLLPDDPVFDAAELPAGGAIDLTGPQGATE